MLNIKELGDLFTDKNAPPEDTRTILIVIALVEQRIVLERIAELLDVARLNWGDIGSQLDRIAGALDDNEEIDAFNKPITEQAANAGPSMEPIDPDD